jgi:hypothetical protein
VRAGGQGWFVQMDILAPVFAYLTVVAGIVGGFFVAFSLVFSPPGEPSNAQRTAAVVSVTQSKGPLLVDAKKPVLKGAVADNPPVNHAVTVAPTTQKREATAQAVAPQANPQQAMPKQVAAAQKPAAMDSRSKTKISRAQWRQIVQQERSRRVAQNSGFEARFLGYAD